ncbi:MAG TPA: DUF6531 domain-containing protein, partial [Thermoanaerobaculia bacterium]|nr:DUF6531 domain-containing protein [Thermoanaerobaculia bacterium]
MRSFRAFIYGPLGRILTAGVITASAHLSADPSNYLAALDVERRQEARILEIAQKMNVDPEFLLHPGGRTRFDFRSLFSAVTKTLGLRSESIELNSQSESIRESIATVKERYALTAADSTLSKIASLLEAATSPSAKRVKKRGQLKSELTSLLRLIEKDFLPAPKEGLSGTAKSRDKQMRDTIKDLRRDVSALLKGKDALSDANIDATLAKLRLALTGRMTLRNEGTRWTRDPFPVKDTYRTAPVRPTGPNYANESSASQPATLTVPSRSSIVGSQSSPSIHPEVAALAATLQTPARIFSYAHDRIEWESYSGVAKGSLGTLKEGRGNDWDQALLLRDLLAAQGYNAQLEWGQVTLPITKAMNLVGTEDPLQAANLLATAGFDGVLLTSGGAPVAVQLTHVWVRAFIPYFPNRGAKVGTPDMWVRMDPSFKRYEYQPGIAINGKVAWNMDEFLNTSAIRPPADFYGDKIWSYIRTNNIDCVNLAQVAKLGRVKAENFPFVPGTLPTKIDQLRGQGAVPPADQQQSVTVNLVSETGATIGTFTSPIADLWGKKLSLTFPPATPDDAATIQSYGGLFNTPPYLIRLKPLFSLDDQPVAEGAAISAGAALDMNLTFRQPNVPDDFTHHDVVAGETHTLVLDAGAPPDSLIQSRIERLKILIAANASEDAILSEQLNLVGLRYMQHVDDGLAFATGVRWQRAVKRVFEADVRRQIDITYNIAGAPLRLRPAENNIDVSRLLVGIVPINNDQSNRAEALSLAGLQSSYLEGAIWEEMQSERGISAAKALLLARAAGQALHTVTSANVDAVLAQTNLDPEVEAEIRGSVAQGRIAKIPSANISLGRWTGTGYILQDPLTGAATYPISGGMAGGSTTGEIVAGIKELLGSESWLEGSPLGALLGQLMALLGGGDGANEAPSTTQSDPVNMSSGNMHRTMSDVSIVARGIPVALTRTYNSRSTYNGPFGHGWTWNYGEQLIANGDGSMTYRESDGTEHLFRPGAGSTFVSPPGKFIELVSNGSGWTMTFKGGHQFSFDSRGDLIAQSDLSDNEVIIQRDATGNPTSVVDATGRTVLTFTFTNGKVTEVTDLANRKTVYAYDGDDLVSVTDTAGKTWALAYDLAHNMTQFRDPVGNTQSFDYDSDDRMFHHVDATGAEEFFRYDIAGRRSVVTDRQGNDRLIKFDDDGRATLEADPAGNVVTATFDADNNRTAMIDSRGNETTYEFDESGNLTRKVTPDGAVTTTSYDAQSRPLTSVDAAGLTTTNSYDSAGNLTTSTRSGTGVNETTTNTYDGNGQLLSTTDPNGGTSSMTWNTNGTMATRTDAANQTTVMTSDALGRISTIKDPANNTTTLAYDGRDRILSMTDPHSNTTSFAYDDAGRRTAVTTPRGTTNYTYDAEGRALSVRDPLGNTTRTTYDIAGNVLTKMDARGNTTRYEYDAVGRITKMIDANGGVWTYGYCASMGGSSCSSCGGGGGSSFCELTDPNGHMVKQDFDKMGRVIAVTDSLGHKSETIYDTAGRKTLEKDANGNATAFGYDSAGRLTDVTEASGAVTRYTYDKNGNKLTQKDANGNTWSFKYDLLNRLVEEADPLVRKTTYAYDALGNLKTKTDAKNQTVTYTYAVRRLTRAAHADGRVDTFTYDAQGRRTGASNSFANFIYTFDALNRLTSKHNTLTGYKSIYDYDAAGNTAKLTTLYGNAATTLATTTYSYDAKNRLAAISDTLFGKFTFGYDPMDRRTELEYPNGIVASYDYDDAYRLTAMVSKDAAGAVVDAWSYRYDSVGNRTSKTDMDGKTEDYRYDNVYRLTDVAYADGSFEKFTYDPVGNRLARADSFETTTYSYDIANQL